MHNALVRQTTRQVQGFVGVRYGPYLIEAAVTGWTVGRVKQALRTRWSVPYFAAASVNGRPTFVTAVLRAGDRLDFILLPGRKGRNDADDGDVGPLLDAHPGLRSIAAEVAALGRGVEQSIELTTARVAEYFLERFGRYTGRELLTIREVAVLLSCSYGEARNRMLDGRIASVKDGRWCRARRQDVEDYLAHHAVRPPTDRAEELADAVPSRWRRKGTTVVQTGGIADEFLRERRPR